MAKQKRKVSEVKGKKNKKRKKTSAEEIVQAPEAKSDEEEAGPEALLKVTGEDVAKMKEAHLLLPFSLMLIAAKICGPVLGIQQLLLGFELGIGSMVYAELRDRENDESVKEEKSDLKEKSTGNKKANRFHPYSKEKNSGTGEKKGPNRNRVFISNIPYDMKWQAIKDLMREKVGEVTYVELFKDAEGKSRDPDGENARRALQRTGGTFPGGHVPDMGSGLMNLPPSILNNPNIPPEVISNLQAGRLGSTIFVANDDKSVPHEDYRSHDSKTPQLPRGLGGIGMGLGPGGQPISASQLNIGGVMGNLGPSGIGFGGLEAMNSMGGFGGVGRMGELYRGAMTSSMERDFGRGDIGINRGFGDSFGRLGGGMGGMNSVTGGMGMGLDRMSSSFDRMGPGIGAILERSIDMDRGFLSGPIGSGMRDRIGSKGNQIFVRNLPFDLTWQKLKEKFSQCGHVMFAEIKMENGKSKGCGTVRFDSPESAEKACRIMNGIKISGREIDVRLDRNA
ncbi:Myelin expression factor 2 [Tupaia chinensis]|uniref:Myelin expression factor 2 n=1 Tax=Tupaia chinensis TaxID=246437 RepID=L9KMK9_TUPCH|nr:Myelin expression factor 2 [Tupaia chinensis]